MEAIPGFLVCEKSNLSPVGSTVNGLMNISLGRKRITAASNPDNDFESIDGVEDAPAKGAATGQTPGAT